MINLIDPEVVKNPHPHFAKLQAEAPVFYYKTLRGWLVTRHSDVMTVLRHSEASSEFMPITLNTIARSLRDQLTPAVELLGNMAIFNDAPRHTRLRSHFAKAFTPRRVTQMRAEVQTIADHLIGKLLEHGNEPVDFMEAVAVPMPVQVIGSQSLLAIPVGDLDDIKNWSDSIITLQAGFIRSKDIAAEIQSSMESLRGYFADLIEHRRANPGVDLISALVQAQDADEALSDEEIIATCLLLLVAGHETTTYFLGNSVHALDAFPQQQQWLRANLGRAKTAYEELLRFDGPIVILRRLMKADLELGGETIEEGKIVYAVLSAANRDADVFENPHALDLTRAENPHVAFGYGSHFCIGAPLARLEAEIALSTLLQRVPCYEVDTDNVEWLPDLRLRGHQRLPIRIIW